MRGSRVNFDRLSDAGPHLLMSSSSRRVGVVLFPPQGGIATFSNEPSPALGQGITLGQASPPAYLDLDAHGDIVQREWYVIYSLAGLVSAYVEIMG